jgi:hypothetical protein
MDNLLYSTCVTERSGRKHSAVVVKKTAFDRAESFIAGCFTTILLMRNEIACFDATATK